MLPSERYQQLQQQAVYKTDPLQAQAVLRLDAFYARLLAPAPWYAWRKPIQGADLWGQVGIGKSFLTDLFFDCLPDIGKTRLHCQHFMACVPLAELYAGGQFQRTLSRLIEMQSAAYRDRGLRNEGQTTSTFHEN